MSLADLDVDHDPSGLATGKHRPERRLPGGVGVARLVARWRYDHGRDGLPANPVRGRWAE